MFRDKSVAEFLYENLKGDRMDIVYSGLRTPDGTLLESWSRHDYVTHLDANGKEYMLDGGLDYVRCSANGDERLLTLTLDDDHDTVRLNVTWGTYGPNGDQPFRRVKIADMETDHLEKVIELSRYVYPQIIQVMKNELEYRKLV